MLQRSLSVGLIASLATLLAGAGAGRAADELRVASPNNLVQLKVLLDEGRLQFAATFKNQVLHAALKRGAALAIELHEGRGFIGRFTRK